MTRVEKGIAWLDTDWRSITLMALIVFVFFSPSLISPNILIWPNSGFSADIIHFHWPDLVSFASHLRQGQLAIWDSSMALGMPIAGDPGAIFLYPPTLIFLFLPPALSFNLLNAIHVFIGGAFTFLFLRSYTISRPSALIGGLIFAFAPKVIIHIAAGHLGMVWCLMWLPAVLFGLKRAMDGSLFASACAGLATAITMPNMIQISYYIMLVASAFGCWHLAFALSKKEWQQVRRLIIIFAVYPLSFILFASFVLFPLSELLPYNSRANFTVADANLYALPSYLLITWLAPTLFQFPEWTIFMGVLSQLLVVIALIQSHRSISWFFAMMILLTLIFSLGAATPLFEFAFRFIPGFGLLRVPTRAWFFGAFSVAVLGGFGTEKFSDGRLRDDLQKFQKWIGRLAGIYIVGGITAFAIDAFLFQRWHGQLALQLITFIAFLTLFFAWLRGRLNARLLQWLLIPLLLFDLLPLDATYIQLNDVGAKFLKPSPSFEFIASHDGIFRVYSPGGDFQYALAAERGVETLEGLLSLQLSHSVRVINEATGCLNAHYATAVPPCLYDRFPIAIPNAEKLGKLNVRFVSTQNPLEDPNFKLIFQNDHRVYENLLWQPRVRITNGKAEIVRRETGRYEIKVRANETTELIVSDSWAPGWGATVDGIPVKVDRVEGALIGIKIESGDHLIHLIYDPIAWRVGWQVSFISIIAWSVWLIIILWRQRR
ncbi:MAG: YfhO family protein [Chloroflexi bacterium]|nr:YfhO family protein [Chloroflexota bacterium]